MYEPRGGMTKRTNYTYSIRNDYFQSRTAASRRHLGFVLDFEYAAAGANEYISRVEWLICGSYVPFTDSSTAKSVCTRE